MPKGWFVTYIGKSPETLTKEVAIAKKAKMDRDGAEGSQRMVEDQIMRALAAKKGKVDKEEGMVYSELQRSKETEKVSKGSRISCEEAETILPLPSTASRFVRKKFLHMQVLLHGVVNPLEEADLGRPKKKKAEEGNGESRSKDSSRKQKPGASEDVLKMEKQQKQSQRES